MKILTTNNLEKDTYTTVLSFAELTDTEKEYMDNFPSTIQYSTLPVRTLKVKMVDGSAVIADDGVELTTFKLPNKEVSVCADMKITFEVNENDEVEYKSGDVTLTPDEICVCKCKVFEKAILDALTTIKTNYESRSYTFEGSYTTEI